MKEMLTEDKNIHFRPNKILKDPNEYAMDGNEYF